MRLALAAIVLLAILATVNVGVGYANYEADDFSFNVELYPSERVVTPGETASFRISVSFMVSYHFQYSYHQQFPPKVDMSLYLPEDIEKYVSSYITYYAENLTGTLTLTLSQETPLGTYEVTIHATAGGRMVTATAILIVVTKAPPRPEGDYFWRSRYFGSVDFFNRTSHVMDEKPVGTFFLGITVGAWLPNVTKEGRYTLYYYVTRNPECNCTDRPLILHIDSSPFGVITERDNCIEENGTLFVMVGCLGVGWSWNMSITAGCVFVRYEKIAEIPLGSWDERKVDFDAYDIAKAPSTPPTKYWFLDWFLIPLLIVLGVTCTAIVLSGRKREETTEELDSSTD